MTKSTTRAEVPPEQSEADDRKAKLRQAYGAATQQLRENHKDEFQKLYQAKANSLGIDWTPRLTEREKAEKAFDQLLIDYPELRERVPATQGEGQEG